MSDDPLVGYTVPDLSALGDLPEAEQECSTIIGLHLVLLSSFLQHFGDALSLMEFARRSSNFDQLPWTAVAARDGAITVFNFGKSIEIIIANTSRCKTLMGKIDHEQLRTAGRLLRQHFPRFEGIRHSITHMAEFHSSVAKIRSHRVTKHPQGDPLIDKVLSMGPLFPGGDLFGQTFIAAHDGKALSYELNSASLAALRSIMDAAYRPFTPSKDH